MQRLSRWLAILSRPYIPLGGLATSQTSAMPCSFCVRMRALGSTARSCRWTVALWHIAGCRMYNELNGQRACVHFPCSTMVMHEGSNLRQSNRVVTFRSLCTAGTQHQPGNFLCRPAATLNIVMQTPLVRCPRYCRLTFLGRFAAVVCASWTWSRASLADHTMSRDIQTPQPLLANPLSHTWRCHHKHRSRCSTVLAG
jgi:hypothetical protein